MSPGPGPRQRKGPQLFHPLLSEWSRGRLPLADFLFIHSTGIWLPFPERRRRFDWLRAGPSWYLSNHTLGLIHVKQARPVNSLITELQHFITQQAKSWAGGRAWNGVKRGLNTFATKTSTRGLMDLSLMYYDPSIRLIWFTLAGWSLKEQSSCCVTQPLCWQWDFTVQHLARLSLD